MKSINRNISHTNEYKVQSFFRCSQSDSSVAYYFVGHVCTCFNNLYIDDVIDTPGTYFYLRTIFVLQNKTEINLASKKSFTSYYLVVSRSPTIINIL